MGFQLKVKLLKNNVPMVKGLVRKEVLRAANETAYEVASIAAQLVPVRTGYLKSTIGLQSYRGGELLMVVVTADYAGFIEFGTRFMDAQPFLRPAWESVRSRLRQKLRGVVRGVESQASTAGVRRLNTR